MSVTELKNHVYKFWQWPKLFQEDYKEEESECNMFDNDDVRILFIFWYLLLISLLEISVYCKKKSDF